MMLKNQTRLTIATAIFAGLCPFALHAQSTHDADTDSTATPTSNIFAVNSNPLLDLAASAGLNYSSSNSSTDIAVDPDTAGTLNLGAATQPPPRRRYGRPRYNDSSHNSDGSNKWEFALGVGATIPIGNTYHYLNTSYGLQFGGGRDWNKHFGVLLQFDYDRFGFNGRTIYNQTQLYNYYCNLAGIGACAAGLDGNSHVWSFTLNPHYNFVTGDTWGAYVVAGGGFFHKTANFTVPSQGEYCNGLFCETLEENQTIDKYSSNAPGVNGGFGITYKPSRFGGERIFAEARYNLMLNSQRSGVTAYSSMTTLNNYTGENFYPANSNRTTWIDYKFGLRF
jgi:hypothetical protein